MCGNGLRYERPPHAPVRCMSLSCCVRVVLAVNPYYPAMSRIQRIHVDTVDAMRCLHGNQLARQVIPSTDEIVPFGRDDFRTLSPWVDQSTPCPCHTLRKTFCRKLCCASCMMVRYLHIRERFSQSCGLRGRLLSSTLSK